MTTFGTVDALPRGTGFVRLAMALAGAKGGNRGEALQRARGWTAHPEVARVIQAQREGFSPGATYEKTAVDPGDTTAGKWGDALAEYNYLASEFAQALLPLTILGRLVGARTAPFNVKIPRGLTSASVAWIGPGLAAPATGLTFDTLSIPITKAAGIIALTRELVLSARPDAETLVGAELMRGMVAFLDRQFTDPAVNAVAGVSPASITHGITPVASTGSTALEIASDLVQMMVALADADVPFTNPFWLMKCSDAARLAGKRSTTGALAFPDIKPTGGLLFGIPVLTSSSVAGSVSGGNVVILCDASLISIADEGFLTVDASDEASIQLDTAPSNSAHSLVSLWQNGLAGLRITAYKNWVRRHDEGVIFLDGAQW